MAKAESGNRRSSRGRSLAQRSRQGAGRSGRSAAGQKNSSTTRRASQTNRKQADQELLPLILLFLLFVVLVILCLCMYGVITGVFGPAVRSFMLGLFGRLAYIFPALGLFGLGFYVYLALKEAEAPAGNRIAGFVLFWVFLGILFVFPSKNMKLLEEQLAAAESDFSAFSTLCRELYAAGAGIIFGIPAYLLYKFFGQGGGSFISILLLLLSIILFAGRGFFDGLLENLRLLFSARDQAGEEYTWREGDEEGAEEEEAPPRRVPRAREAAASLAEEWQDARMERMRQRAEQTKRRREEERKRREAEERAEDERILRASDTSRLRISEVEEALKLPPKRRLDDIHEITLLSETTTGDQPEENEQWQEAPDEEHWPTQELTEISYREELTEEEAYASAEEPLQEEEYYLGDDTEADAESEGVADEADMQAPMEAAAYEEPAEKEELSKPRQAAADEEVKEKKPKSLPDKKSAKKDYEPPALSLLKDAAKGAAASRAELNETKSLLEQTLRSFNVEARVTDMCQGPSVTRFELQLGEGIKVNKILGLSDDIKLKLAAEEIRIEAPIPGKAAVGIEVPNKERIPVSLKELLASPEFKKASSKLSFAVGKDISGHVIIGDIAKMPHLLVAGTTGSGKSVFTNSIIQSILFKARPEEVKLILIDPKVVEFSVYNGIPHLLMPVVTDPKKANQALAWAVAEMSRRYKVFGENSVRGISGYNELVDSGALTDEEGKPAERMYQIVIVVDELADLMMVAGKEVEDSICRIAQLARAAGIHLIIATQRPSVDVITGLIKANMPSRVALKCGSGVDSRTILDTVGAEKLLGNGDMLYLPQGFNKPLRVQGAFVSDGEVQKVSEFLKSQLAEDAAYDKRVEEEMSHIELKSSSDTPESAGNAKNEHDDGLDEYFEDACRFVVEKEKASSGMLQRVFKVGYNRAARIVDQMEAAGVVGPEEGTKPRKVLMNAETLEQFLRDRKKGKSENEE